MAAKQWSQNGGTEKQIKLKEVTFSRDTKRQKINSQKAPTQTHL